DGRISDHLAVACAFDLLMHDGDDLRRRPFRERKLALGKLLIRSRGGIQYVEHTEGHGEKLFEAVCDLGLEGIVSKRLTSVYKSGLAEHKAVTAALSKAVEHALQAGAYLAEAKEQLKHGQWLPWLKRCEISSRTAQLYMQLHKHRDRIEKELRNPESGADLTLNEAAAMCVLAGRLERLMDYARRAQGLSPDELVNLAIKEGFGVIKDE